MKLEPNRKYTTIAAYALGVILISVLFIVMIFKLDVVISILGKICSAIIPIFIGIIIAYVLNPIEVFIEDSVLSRIFKKDKESKAFRKTSVALTMVLFLSLIVTVVAFVVPEIIDSTSTLIVSIPEYGARMTEWVKDTLNNNPSLRDLLINQTDIFIGYIEGLADKAGPILTSFANGVVNAIYGVVQFIIGCIVAIYLLVSKEKFIAQAKKIIVSLTPRNFSYKFFSLSHKINDILIGSVLSKILDSLVVGAICLIGMTIFNVTFGMPYPILISVIICITNVIPFFGPFIGAAPSVFLILIDEISTMDGFEVPIKTIVFLVFILVLQNLDGNILGPKLQGEMTGLSAFWILFAILLGGGLFGFMGMLLAVPVFGITYMMVGLLVNSKLQSRNMPTRTDVYYGKFDKIKEDVYGKEKETENETNKDVE